MIFIGMSWLPVIVKFIKKYSYMLNIDQSFIFYTNYKPLVRFINTNYHKNIFAH